MGQSMQKVGFDRGNDGLVARAQEGGIEFDAGRIRAASYSGASKTIGCVQGGFSDDVPRACLTDCSLALRCPNRGFELAANDQKGTIASFPFSECGFTGSDLAERKSIQ